MWLCLDSFILSWQPWLEFHGALQLCIGGKQYELNLRWHRSLVSREGWRSAGTAVRRWSSWIHSGDCWGSKRTWCESTKRDVNNMQDYWKFSQKQKLSNSLLNHINESDIIWSRQHRSEIYRCLTGSKVQAPQTRDPTLPIMQHNDYYTMPIQQMYSSFKLTLLVWMQ